MAIRNQISPSRVPKQAGNITTAPVSKRIPSNTNTPLTPSGGDTANRTITRRARKAPTPNPGGTAPTPAPVKPKASRASTDPWKRGW